MRLFFSKIVLSVALMVCFGIQCSALCGLDSIESSVLKYEQEPPVEIIETFLTNPVPGLSVSYRDVFDAIIADGHQVYLKGGMIRDLILSPNTLPNDVDFGFSCTQEELIAILAKKRWQYTAMPDYPVIRIGDRAGPFLEGLPKRFTITEDENELEFTVNNIFYSVADQKFILDYQTGLKDLFDRRIRVLSNDWETWFRTGFGSYYKIFRFWKMVGKGFIYRADFEEFIRKKTLQALEEDKDLFREEILNYFSGHIHAYDEIAAGARIIMGEEWYIENIASNKDKFQAKHDLWRAEDERFTFFKTAPLQ